MDNTENKSFVPFPPPGCLPVTTDCVIFGYDSEKMNLEVLLVQRNDGPCKGMWALPGGFVKLDETCDECARRKLETKTQIAAFMEQFHTYSGMKRDDRGRVVTVAYYALIHKQDVKPGGNSEKADWFTLNEVQKMGLAFDHTTILQDAFATLRERIHFKPIGFDLLPKEFTMTQLRHLYEAILGVELDRGNFANKMSKISLNGNMLLSSEEKQENNRKTIIYTFNKDVYEELKKKKIGLTF